MPSTSWLGVAPISVIALTCSVATQVFIIQDKKIGRKHKSFFEPPPHFLNKPIWKKKKRGENKQVRNLSTKKMKIIKKKNPLSNYL
jgi:hypothetical protein